VRIRSWFFPAVFALTPFVGCHSAPVVPPSKHYPIHGSVVGVDKTTNKIDLKAGTIPGFMEAMTMTYPVTDPAAIGELHPGDLISATLLADEDAAGPKNMRLKDIVITGQANPNAMPAVRYHTPTPGETVPDFKLRNQSGKTISFKQLRGKVVILTFIYTRCPLPEYCIRMSQNFAQINKALQAVPALYAKTHLLSISFDPEFDTPRVLKSYGESYIGKFADESFAHWDFAVPSAAELAHVEQYFSVGVTPSEGGALQHSLSTVIIGKDGKIVAFYPSNDWTVEEALAKIKSAS
jgi:protein SCO1/2